MSLCIHINGTAIFLGDATSVSIEDIINYNFACKSNFVNTIILAIPKYINMPNGKQEFSSFNGKMNKFSPFKKACLLDLSNERQLPTAFTLGYQLIDIENNSVKFWQNNHHFSQLPKESQDNIMQSFAAKITTAINDCKNNHNAKSIEDVFDIMSQKHLALIDDYINDI